MLGMNLGISLKKTIDHRRWFKAVIPEFSAKNQQDDDQAFYLSIILAEHA